MKSSAYTLKKYISALLIIISCFFTLSSCSVVLNDDGVVFYDIEISSLQDYKDKVNRHERGYSDFEIDLPKYFLPSLSFLEDFDYTEGTYYFFETDFNRLFFTNEIEPSKAIICLKYDENAYSQAKDFMLQEIEPYEDKFFEYGNYVFYENSNFAEENGLKGFPLWFTMACYNDEKQTLCFLGFYVPGGTTLFDEKYLTDIDNNWEDFIDEFFGEYYDFSE